MLCEKNRYRGTLFEYELMHNFHYCFYVLHPLFSLALLQRHPLPISTSARRITGKKYDVGRESSRRLVILFLAVFQW